MHAGSSDVDAGSLSSHVRGEVLLPADAGYDGARHGFNGAIDRRPLAIVRPVDTPDIVAAVRWAVERDLGVGVRGGGHSVAGHSAPEGALLVDLSRWRSVRIDPVRREATVQGGALLLDLDTAMTAQGLATPTGTFVDTGVVGLALGGGISHLLGTEGFACDAIVGAELVTAAGEVLEVDAEHDPELLWGLRGGGGNFGIVTRLRSRLTAVPSMYGGKLQHRGPGVRDLLARLLELEARAPDELVMQVVLARDPDTDEPLTRTTIAYRGEASAGAALIAPLRAAAGLTDDGVRDRTWLELQTDNDLVPFGLRHYWKGHFVRTVTPELLDALLAAVAAGTGDDRVLVEFIHGAANRIDPGSAAFGGRGAAANITALTTWSSPLEDERHRDWARAAAALIEPWSLRGGGYLNYGEDDAVAPRVRDAFDAASFRRLAALKRRLDPGNHFRFNANIPPA